MNLARVDLNLLVALDALIAERHVTRAAQRVHLSQPAMSNALARLRRMFGDELLVRVGREYRLTALAEELREPLRDLLQLAQETVQRRPRFDPATDSRVFTVVASDYSAYLLLQPLMRWIDERAPGVTLQLQRSTRGEPEKAQSDLNLGLWPSPTAADLELPCEILFHDRWVCVVWEGNDRVADRISRDQYLSLPHVIYGRALDEVLGIADRAVLGSTNPRHVQASTDSFLLLPFLLEGTHLVALLQERLALRLAEAAKIRLVEPLFETPPVAEAMYWHPRHTSDPAHRWLRSLLRELAAEL
ncbi:MAG TPA: LysR family transcriptional regulator [Candidatus Dormibacteraeota bacterium]|nr:LysR family transcriptional regulator [Candidatus Dormibacteraeota bacterium]